MSGHVALCTYRVKPGMEETFEGHLRRHWPTLDAAGLVTEQRSEVFKGREEDGATFYVEVFEWKDSKAVDEAHDLPDVMMVWEPMGMCVEDRDGRPGMEFPHVERLDLSGG